MFINVEIVILGKLYILPSVFQINKTTNDCQAKIIVFKIRNTEFIEENSSSFAVETECFRQSCIVLQVVRSFF